MNMSDNITPSTPENTEGKHTPTPWIISYDSHGQGKNEIGIGIIKPMDFDDSELVLKVFTPYTDKARANAMLIVTAVNSYSQLKAENEALTNENTVLKSNLITERQQKSDVQLEFKTERAKLQSDNEAKEATVKELTHKLRLLVTVTETSGCNTNSQQSALNECRAFIDRIDSE